MAITQQTVMQFEYFYPAWQRWFENRVYPFTEGISITFQTSSKTGDILLTCLRAFAVC
ncbi:hypothetical protein [Nostoc sp.]|uniref:hypothetical protein n=1 Tax=Nostoc sp. TaxID=1180 RepID=UPI002FFA1A7F